MSYSTTFTVEVAGRKTRLLNTQCVYQLCTSYFSDPCFIIFSPFLPLLSYCEYGVLGIGGLSLAAKGLDDGLGSHSDLRLQWQYIPLSLYIAGCLENVGRKKRMICLCDPYFQAKHFLKHPSSCYPCYNILLGYKTLETADAGTRSLPVLTCHLQIRKLRSRKEKGCAKVKGRMWMRTRRIWTLWILWLF